MRKTIKQIKKNPTLSCINPNAAGIDIGAKSHFVAIPEGRGKQLPPKVGSFQLT
ncbi:MAG: hypothetical protein IT584_01825 [Chlamydiae bacterium]|nr:hypothetical protein [Chlamydiota bacterium]